MKALGNNTMYGFGIKNLVTYPGMEGVFTECDLVHGTETVGHCVLSGDGGADKYDFPTDSLNHVIVKHAMGLPEWCRGEYGEPFALSYVVASLADMHDGGQRDVHIGNDVECRAELGDIRMYRQRVAAIVARHRH